MYVVHSMVDRDLRKSIAGKPSKKAILECIMYDMDQQVQAHYKQQDMSK